jgi:CubicO group peptidase (beta-lactamase class C family)
MRKILAAVAFLLALTLFHGQFPAEEAPKPPAAAAKLAEQDEVASSIRLLEAWIESQMASRNLPGLSIAIVHDQDIVWSKGFGYADVEKKTPATPGTVYRIASISKLFTTTAILQLRDQGKLKLDDPVEKYLPWFKVKHAQADAPITIRQLLVHTAGLPRESAFPYWSDMKFPSREDMIKALANQEAVYPPETKWKYSNLGLAVAGEVVAAVSGEAYEDYVTKHILTPLGMKSSSVGVLDSNRARLAVGYGRRLGTAERAIRPFTDARGINPAAGLASTVEDLARFASLQFRDGPAGGAQILKGSTLREMQRVQWLMPDWKSGRGLGFHILHREDGDLVGHSGWVAGYQTAVYFRPQDKIAVVAMINADDGLPYPGSPDSVVDRAFKWVGPALQKATTPVDEVKPRPEWQKYVGKYRSPWADTQVLVMNGKLVMINPTEPDPTGSLATLVPMGEHSFRIEDGSPSGPHGERVVFELGKDEKVVRVKIGENYSYPEK